MRIVSIGFGSEEGSQITLVDPDTGARTLLTDRDGKPVECPSDRLVCMSGHDHDTGIAITECTPGRAGHQRRPVSGEQLLWRAEPSRSTGRQNHTRNAADFRVIHVRFPNHHSCLKHANRADTAQGEFGRYCSKMTRYWRKMTA